VVKGYKGPYTENLGPNVPPRYHEGNRLRYMMCGVRGGADEQTAKNVFYPDGNKFLIFNLIIYKHLMVMGKVRGPPIN
jgi:hypothetical protein